MNMYVQLHVGICICVCTRMCEYMDVCMYFCICFDIYVCRYLGVCMYRYLNFMLEHLSSEHLCLFICVYYTL